MVVIIFYIIISFATGSAQTYSEMDYLLEYLFNASRYNRLLRPLQNQSHVMMVNFTQYMTSIDHFDISSGELLVTGFFELTWQDELLTWDPSMYGGKEIIHLPKEMIWKPEISFSSVSGEQDALIGNSGFAPAWVNYQGYVTVIPVGKYKTRCDIDTTSYPFDKHGCSFQFFVSNHDVSELTLYSPRGDLDTSTLTENGEWLVENTNALIAVVHEENIEKSFVAMSEVSFTLKRRPAFEMINIFAYVLLMTVLNTLTCFIRPDSGERLSFAVTLYLALVFASTALIERFPNNSLKMPYVSYGILMTNFINTASVGWSIYIVRLASTPSNARLPLPQIVCNIVLKRKHNEAPSSNRIVPDSKSGGAKESSENKKNQDEKKVDGKEEKYERELSAEGISGIEIAKSLDKIYFVFVSLVFFIMNIVFIPIIVVN